MAPPVALPAFPIPGAWGEVGQGAGREQAGAHALRWLERPRDVDPGGAPLSLDLLSL